MVMMESPRATPRPQTQPAQSKEEEEVDLELLVRKIAKCDRLLSSSSKKSSKNPTTTKRLLGKRAEYLQQLGEMTYRAALESMMEDEQPPKEHDVVASSLKSPTGVTERLDVSTTTFFQEDPNHSSFVSAAGLDDSFSSTPTKPLEVFKRAPPVLVSSSSSSPVNTLKQKKTSTTTTAHNTPPMMVLPSTTHSHSNSDSEGGVTQKKPASPSTTNTTTTSSSLQVQKHNLDLLLSSLPVANTQDLEEDQSNEQQESSSSLPTTTTSVQAARRMVHDAQDEEEEEDSTLADTLGREDEPMENHKDRMPKSAPAVVTSQAEPTVAVVESPPVEAAVAAAAAETETVEDGSIADTIDSSSNHEPVLLEETDDKAPSSLSSSSSSDENVMLKAVQTLQRLEQHDQQQEKATTKEEESSSLANTAVVPPPPPPMERQKDDRTTTPIITTPKTKTTKKKKKKSKAYSDGSIHKKVRGKFDTLESSSSKSNHPTGSPRRSTRPKRAEPLMMAAPPPILNEKTTKVVEDTTTTSTTSPPSAVTSKTVAMQVRVTQPASSSDETKGLMTKQIDTTLQQAVMTSSVHDIQSPVIALVSLFPESLYEFLPQQSRALLILQALDIQPIYIDGSDPKEKDRRNELFDLSGKRGVYPQLFVRKQETGKVEYFADFEKIQVLHDCGILKESLEKAYQ